jgi:predicted RNA-binding protein with PUA-like domain
LARRCWFFLSDPEDYHLDDLFRTGRTVWDGVKGGLAQKYLREVRKGDLALCYHTAPEKRVYAIARVVTDPYPDPSDPEGKRVVVDVAPEEKLVRPIPLSELRAEPALQEMRYLKMARLSVSPVTPKEWRAILAMGRAGKQ